MSTFTTEADRSTPTQLDELEALVRKRRAHRHFQPDPLPEGLVERLLDIVRWSPSGYHLQPTHFVVVRDPSLRQALGKVCLGQPQVTEAPETVVFTGDRHVLANMGRPTIGSVTLCQALSSGFLQQDW